jgi:hypothetical protein
MPPVSQRVPDLLGGVSQLAPHRRRPNELEDSLNALHSPLRGFGKRPPTVHVAQLSASISALTDAKIFPLDYGTGQKFFAAIVDGDLKVWSRDGVEQNVSFPHGKLYLNTPADLPHGLLEDFTDTNAVELRNHTATPFLWTRQYLSSGSADPATIQGNTLTQTDSTGITMTYSADAGLTDINDYRLSVRGRLTVDNVNAFLEIAVRVQEATGAGYYLRIHSNTPTVDVDIIRRSSWSDTSGTTVATFNTDASFLPTDDHTYAVECEANTFRAYVDGVEVASGVDATYPTSSIVGLKIGGGNVGSRRWVIDDYELTWAENLPSDALGVIRTVTTGRRTFIVNRNKKILRDTTQKAAVQTPQAILYVEQADYSTVYSVTLDGTAVSYETQAGADAGARRDIGTDTIAQEIYELLVSTFSSFTFTLYGSMIRVVRTDSSDFTISAKDGLGDNGLRAVKGIVQSSQDLPLRCINGFVLEVAGEADSAQDNYWVKFDTDGSDDFRGVWKECARPGTAIALDASTMPHELVYSDRKTPEMEAAGFPASPVVSLGGNITKDYESWSATLNGADISNTALPVLDDHGDDIFVNFEDTNGGPIKFGCTFGVDTTKLTKGETMILTFAYNDGAASTNWTTFYTALFGPGEYGRRTAEAEVAANLGVNFDVRVMVEYDNGATPASKGRLTFLPNQMGVWYYNYSARDLTWQTDLVYPAGTEWSVTVDALTPVTYTQTEDMTGAEIAAALEPGIEALAGIDSSIVSLPTGTAIRITKTGGGLPTVVVASTFAAGTTFWNPELDFGYADNELIGYTLKNLSDGSEGAITSNTQNLIVVDALAGGVDNTFHDGDLCVVVDASDTFTFRQVDWKEREAGDSITNPWPSFVDNYVRDLFFHRGRLGMLSAGNIILSETTVPDNFFRTVTTDLIDTDPIDVMWAGNEATQFHSAVPWNGDIVCFGDRVQIVPRGEPVLSPKTIRLEQLSAYPCDPTLHPASAGRWVFFGRSTDSEARISALGISPRTRVAEAVPVSGDLADFLAGSPQFLAADSDLQQLFLVTDTDQKNLFHMRYTMGDDQPPAYSWGKWTFTGEVLGMVVIEATLYLIMLYSDGVYLETLSLSENY